MLDSAQRSPYKELAHVMGVHNERQSEGLVSCGKTYTALHQELAKLKSRSGDESWDVIWEMVDSYLENSVKTAHPMYFNQLWAGQSEPALIGGVIELLANTSMYTFEVAPMATVVEDEMRSVFARQLGFENWESQVTTGGSNSNYLALLLALNRSIPDMKLNGVTDAAKRRVYVSADSHYSMEKSVMMAGLGLGSLVKVPTDERGAMDVKALTRFIETDVANGLKPCMIAGTAGTTVKGAFDPFDDLADVASLHSCWLHVDGAWGGALTYSSSAGHVLSGTERADSFSWDAHKMLGVPLMCSLLFVQEKGAFNKAFNLGNTSYIFHEDDEASHDLGPASLQCGRRVDMLKMWFEYLFYGKQGFEARIEHFLKLAEMAEHRIQREPDLELQSERWINNICFRSRPTGMNDKDELNKFNKTVRERLKKSGDALVNQAYLGDDLTIRLIIANKDVTSVDVTRFFDLWLSESRELEKEWK